MTLVATAHTEIVTQAGEIEQARLQLTTSAFAIANEQYRSALAAGGEHRTDWMTERVAAKRALRTGPGDDMDRGARHALNTAACHVLYSGSTPRRAVR